MRVSREERRCLGQWRQSQSGRLPAPPQAQSRHRAERPHRRGGHEGGRPRRGEPTNVGGKPVQGAVSFFTSMSFCLGLIKVLRLVTHGSLRAPPGACGGDKVVDPNGSQVLNNNNS